MNKLHDTLKNMHEPLTQSERDTMHAHLREYMAHTPIRSAQPTPPISPRTRFFALHYRATAVFVALALVVTSGAGLAYASTDALPGDALYGVKLAREGVQAALIQGDVARAEFAVERAHTRLQEIEQLAARGTLTDEREARTTKRAEESQARAQTQIDALVAQQPAEAAALSFTLTAGVDARLAALTQPRTEAPEAVNAQRARIARALGAVDERAYGAHAARVHTSASAPEMLATFESASAPALMAVTADVSLDAHDTQRSAMVFETAVVQEASPGEYASLSRAIAKQYEALEALHETATDEDRLRIEEALTRVVQFNAQAVHGDAKAARELLRFLHTTRVEIETGATIAPPLPFAPTLPMPTDMPVLVPHPLEALEEPEESAPPTRAPQPLPVHLELQTETQAR